MSAEPDGGGSVTVIGEALVDLVPGQVPWSFTAHPGGSPYNVAIGLARLKQRTTLMARIADNAFGRLLRERAVTEGCCLDAAPHASEPTTLAVVSLDADAQASYDFYRDGTADWQWTAEEIDRVPTATAVLHFGSLASWTRPGDELIYRLASRLHGQGDVLVSYDPNIRPLLLPDHDEAVRMVERSIRVAHLVKASSEDACWLYPDSSMDDIVRRWLRLGATCVVITEAAGGASAFAASLPSVRRPAVRVSVVDTVGAGDAFTAGLLSSFRRRGQDSPARLAGMVPAELAAALDDAMLVAGLTCQRPGADPPLLAELESEQRRRSGDG